MNACRPNSFAICILCGDNRLINAGVHSIIYAVYRMHCIAWSQLCPVCISGVIPEMHKAMDPSRYPRDPVTGGMVLVTIGT